LPYRRSKIKQELRTGINDLRGKLNTALNRQFETELKDSVQRVREAVAPYTRFVRIEREKLEKLSEELNATSAQIEQLRATMQHAL
jgi:DNA-directed RNA polymerase subunit F